MRIIGGHDFYDSALAYGQDTQVVLVREKERTIPNKEAENLGFRHRRIDLPYRSYRDRSVWQTCVVIIGDTQYNGVVYEAYSEEPCFAWTEAAFEKLLKEKGAEVEKYNMSARFRRWTRSSRYWRNRQIEEAPVDYFDPIKIKGETRDYMIAERISILVSSQSVFRDGWVVNPDCLKDLDFAKRVDPYTLFQELDMWVSGVLGMAARPMVEVSNDIKVAKHGFDRWSFRKPKASS